MRIKRFDATPARKPTDACAYGYAKIPHEEPEQFVAAWEIEGEVSCATLRWVGSELQTLYKGKWEPSSLPFFQSLGDKVIFFTP